MSRFDPINPDPFCPVQLTQLEHRGRRLNLHIAELQDPLTGEYREIPGSKGVHSERYRLVPNRQVHDMALSVLERTGLKFQPLARGQHGSITWTGKQYAERWYSPEVDCQVPGGSSMHLGVQACNSYDGSQRVSLSFFAMHVICSNQFHSKNLMGDPFSFQHLYGGGSIDQDFDAAYDAIVDKAGVFGRMAPRIECMANRKITSFEDYLRFRTAMQQRSIDIRETKLLNELQGDGISKELQIGAIRYGTPPSYWDVANAFTAIATHDIETIQAGEQAGHMVDWLVSEATAKVA